MIKKNKQIAPVISICILTYNRKADLVKTIQFIKKSKYKSFEIVVVDNSSTDGTGDIIPKKFPDVVYIHNKNEGISGWNIAFKHAKGEFILATDDDAHPSRDALGQIVDVFTSESQVDIIACNIINFTTHKSAFPYEESLRKAPRREYDFIGCGVAIRKKIFKKIGYFAPWIFMYAHETEFSLRALKKGVDVWLYPSIVVYHRVSPVGRTSGRSIYYCTRNFLSIAWLYFPLPYALDVTTAFLSEAFILSLLNHEMKYYFKGIVGWVKNSKFIIENRAPLTQKALAPFAEKFVFSWRGVIKRIVYRLSQKHI